MPDERVAWCIWCGKRETYELGNDVDMARAYDAMKVHDQHECEKNPLRQSHARLLQVAKIASEGGTPHPGYQAFAREVVAEAEKL